MKRQTYPYTVNMFLGELLKSVIIQPQDAMTVNKWVKCDNRIFFPFSLFNNVVL